jgi:hypothetical protein
MVASGPTLVGDKSLGIFKRASIQHPSGTMTGSPVVLNPVCAHQPNDHVADTIENLTNSGARQPGSSADVYPGRDILEEKLQ